MFLSHKGYLLHCKEERDRQPCIYYLLFFHRYPLSTKNKSLAFKEHIVLRILIVFIHFSRANDCFYLCCDLSSLMKLAKKIGIFRRYIRDLIIFRGFHHNRCTGKKQVLVCIISEIIEKEIHRYFWRYQFLLYGFNKTFNFSFAQTIAAVNILCNSHPPICYSNSLDVCYIICHIRYDSG